MAAAPAPLSGCASLTPDPARVNGFAGALPLLALLSGDASLMPDPVILSTAKDLVMPDLIGDLLLALPGESPNP